MGIASRQAHAIGLPVEWSSCDSAAIAKLLLLGHQPALHLQWAPDFGVALLQWTKNLILHATNVSHKKNPRHLISNFNQKISSEYRV